MRCLSLAFLLLSGTAYAQQPPQPLYGPGAPGLSGATTVLPNGTTATTQTQGDNSTKIATTAYVDGTAFGSFCTGSAGNLTSSSGTTTLTAPTCYNNVTLSGTAAVKTSGWPMFVLGTLDLSAAPAGAITAHGTTGVGVNASGGTGGTGNTANAGDRITPAGGGSGAGGTGNTTTGSGTTVGTAVTFGVGPVSGAGGAGGNGVSAGASGAAGGTVGSAFTFPYPTLNFFASSSSQQSLSIVANSGAGGGGNGGGDSVNAGGGGGGGGSGSGAVVLFANTIARGSNATAGVISVAGTVGGNGAAGVAGTAGGGGGGGGGAGGFAYIVYRNITGSVITNGIDVSGGSGGVGGNSPLTNKGGTGGTGGASGAVEIIQLGLATQSTGIANGGTVSGFGFGASVLNQAGSAAVTATTTAGTVGGAGATLKVGL